LSTKQLVRDEAPRWMPVSNLVPWVLFDVLFHIVSEGATVRRSFERRALLEVLQTKGIQLGKAGSRIEVADAPTMSAGPRLTQEQPQAPNILEDGELLQPEELDRALLAIGADELVSVTWPGDSADSHTTSVRELLKHRAVFEVYSEVRSAADVS